MKRRKKTRRPGKLATPACILMLFGTAAAQPVPLFNGRDLSGWQAIGNSWTVEDETLVRRGDDTNFGWLITQQPYRDFTLLLEYKAASPSDATVAVRAHFIDGTMYGRHIVVDAHSRQDHGGVWCELRRAWLARPDDTARTAFRRDDWNQYRIEARGDRLRVFLNDAPLAEVCDDRFTQGIIALQLRDAGAPARARWRGIRLEDHDRPADQGYVPLFNGIDLAGWRSAGEERWTVENGAVVGESVTQAYGYLVSQASYANFIARMDFLVEKPYANSGFFFRSAIDGVNIRGWQAEVTGLPEQHPAGIYESGGRGWLAQPDARAQTVLRVDAYNTLEVLADGPRLRTWLNGWPVVELEDEAVVGEGVLALQIHSGGGVKVRFKNLWLKAW